MITRRDFLKSGLMVAAILPFSNIRISTRRNFTDLDELTRWAKYNMAQIADPKATCINYAERFQDIAFRNGLRMSVAYTINGYMLPGLKVNNVPDSHWGNMAVCEDENSVYYIEPQPSMFTIKRIGAYRKISQGVSTF